MARILINNLIRQLNEIQEGSRWFDPFPSGVTAPGLRERLYAASLPTAGRLETGDTAWS